MFKRHNQPSHTTTKSIIWILGMNSGWKKARPSSLSSSQRMIHDCQHRASLHIVVIIWKGSEQLSCCNVKCVNVLCIGMNPCTHSCACNRILHYVIAVNKKIVQFQCKSGRSLIAFGRICFIFVMLIKLNLMSREWIIWIQERGISRNK